MLVGSLVVKYSSIKDKTTKLRAVMDLAEVSRIVTEEVWNVEVVDVHTHLFPPSHGDLMLWGIDSLLTYHYLVAEYFMVAPLAITPKSFFEMSKRDQATLVWKTLFLERTPLSEACRGVLTTLRCLGLGGQLRARDLEGIRKWFDAQTPESYVELVFKLAKVKYCVMTNIPFDEREASEWSNPRAKQHSKRFKAAVRVDPILSGDWETLFRAIEKEGLDPNSTVGAQQFLINWSKRIDSTYFMASTPSGFTYREEQMSDYVAMDRFETLDSGDVTKISTELIDKVLVPVARSENKALALKLGACRGVNHDLDPCGGGDGVEIVDLDYVSSLCTRFPDVKILLTVLSRVNQHKLCVLANKFRNLHVYGCWWYCNNPSMIEEISKQRIEMLGTGFTIQHSDSRVLDQLIYKWAHSRQVIADVLVAKYKDLWETNWEITREEIRRDVGRLFGDAYHEFLEK
mmetsp:Transcript_19245/g.31600  ORF Transcript_19245/g.31600 Transcript_19245/m.31600 type:complete len:458 (-) Transcript_19245:349-1722(-)